MVHRELTLRQLFLWAIGLRRRFRIAGSSMAPTFSHGEEVLVDPRAYRAQAPGPGDVVLARHPSRRALIVKRVARVEPGGACFLVVWMCRVCSLRFRLRTVGKQTLHPKT